MPRVPEDFRTGLLGYWDDLAFRMRWGWKARQRQADSIVEVTRLVDQNCKADNPAYDPSVPWTAEEIALVRAIGYGVDQWDNHQEAYVHMDLHYRRLSAQGLTSKNEPPLGWSGAQKRN